MLRHTCPRTRGLNIIMINIVPKIDLQTQCNPYQTPGHIFIDIGKVRPSGSQLTCIPSFLLQLLRWVPNIQRRLHQMHVYFYALCSLSYRDCGDRELCHPFPQGTTIFIRLAIICWTHIIRQPLFQELHIHTAMKRAGKTSLLSRSFHSSRSTSS